MVQASVERMTLEAFLALPETKPASEYIDGQISQKPMPKGQHSTLQAGLIMSINESLAKRKIAYAFPELRCTFAKRSIVPDVSVFTWPRLPLNEDSEISNESMSHPDWAIEILSPGQSREKVWNKVLHATENGTQVGWLIDPKSRSVETCDVAQVVERLSEDSHVLCVPEFALSLNLTVGDVFGWLKFDR
ncbi:MAG: Uma2 family endonuclease [Cyanobacteria bacterium J06576_12]